MANYESRIHQFLTVDTVAAYESEAQTYADNGAPAYFIVKWQREFAKKHFILEITPANPSLLLTEDANEFVTEGGDGIIL